MKKSIYALSVGSVAIYSISFVLMLIVIAFQALFAAKYYPYYEHTFVIPWSSVFSATYMMCLSILAFFLAGKEKSSVWVNIILIALPVIIVNPLTTLIQSFQTVSINKSDAVEAALKSASLSHVNTMLGVVACLVPVAYAAYMVCAGMRLSTQCVKKKED